MQFLFFFSCHQYDEFLTLTLSGFPTRNTTALGVAIAMSDTITLTPILHPNTKKRQSPWQLDSTSPHELQPLIS